MDGHGRRRPTERSRVIAVENKDKALGEFVELAMRLGRDDFVKRFREPVLVAMGVLETSEILARCGSTVGMRVATPMAYDRKEVHPLAGRVFIVPIESAPRGGLVIGRDVPARVVVPDDTVSGQHCKLSWEGDDIRVTDLGSTNGTMINMRPVSTELPSPLRNEDILTVGRHSFQLYKPLNFFRVLESLATPVDG